MLILRLQFRTKAGSGVNWGYPAGLSTKKCQTLTLAQVGQGMMLMRPTKEFIVFSGLALAFNAINSTVFFWQS